MKGNIPYFDCYHVTRSGMSNIQIKAKYKISIMTMYKYFNERGVIWKKVKR